MNSVNLVGRITNTPEIKYHKDNAHCSFSIVSELSGIDKVTKKPKTTVILCQVWGKMAENLCKYQAKGSLISIQNGEIETSSWVDGNVTKYVTKVQIRPWSSIKYLESSSVTENRVLQSIDKEAQAYEQGI